MNNDWIDPDDAPHLDAAWFTKAEIKRGDEVLRDKDGWIPWSDGHPNGPQSRERISHIRFRNGEEWPNNGYFDWTHYDAPGDIIAYRLAESPSK